MSDREIERRLQAYERLHLQARETMTIGALADIGAFDALRGGARTARELAQATGTGERRLRQFLDAAAFAGFVAKRQGRYALLPGDEALLDPEGPYRRRLGLERLSEAFTVMARAGEVLREDRPLPSVGSGADAASADRRRFLLFLDSRSRRAAEEVAGLLAREPVEQLADLGCGAGTYALALLGQHPRARAILVDRPNAAPVIRACAEAAGLLDRVRILGGDFFFDDYGQGLDLILASNIAHCYDPDANRHWLTRAAESLRPGGRLALKDFVVDEDRRGPGAGIWFAVHMALVGVDGDTYPESEIRGWLGEAGLAHETTYRLREADSWLITARRPG